MGSFAVPGFRIGHWTNTEALTGCTVMLCPPGTVGGCDVRGSSPATRETALLASEKSIQEVHAVLLTGGSAFGLASADGVMRYLEERSIGYRTPWLKVPIVPAAAIFDMNIGDKNVRPASAQGYEACLGASETAREEGNCGAGTGATVGKWSDGARRMKGGLGLVTLEEAGVTVGCVAVVNAVGDVVGADGRVLAGALDPQGGFRGEQHPLRAFSQRRGLLATNTTLMVLATTAKLTKVQANRLAQRAHDGMARAVVPAHTSYDGDIAFALSAGGAQAHFDVVAEMGAEAVAQAIRSAVLHARSAGDATGLAS
jgi:L-aminopeptidase/D-esterase-like protein